MCLLGASKDTEGVVLLLPWQWTGRDSQASQHIWVFPAEAMSSNVRVLTASVLKGENADA